jgi:CheY-like chemotaxis protein
LSDSRDGARSKIVSLVLLTPFGHTAQMIDARPGAVASAYVTKPVREKALYAALAAAFGFGPIAVRESASSAASSAGLAASRAFAVAGPVAPILVAEDNSVNQRVAVAILKRLGYNVRLASNGAEAIQAALSEPHAAILMDCQMPEMDGYEATAAIRAFEGAAGRTPIIAMTANAMEGDRERCLAAGMNDYIAKPIRVDDLRAVLARWTAPQSSEPAALPSRKAAAASGAS